MDILTFTRTIEHFYELDPEMQLNTVLTFMYVANKGYCTQKDLEIGLSMSNGSTSRNVSYWTDSKKFGVDGMGFVNREEDPKDRRYKVLTLSSKGRKFYQKLKS